MADLQSGQLAPKEQRFCPYAAVVKWPYKHLYGEVRRVVSDNYFAFGLFKTHGWHIYYIRTLLDTTDKPLLLIPEEEVRKLFQKIKDEIDVHVDFPSVTEEPGFQLVFLEEGSPRPRYLGTLTDENEVATLEDMIPATGSAAEESEDVDERSFPMFRRHMQLALEASKQKSKAVRDKRRLDRVDVKKKRCAELKRTQCYLGLRKRGTANELDFSTGPNMSWEESQKASQAYEIAAGIVVPSLDISVPAPWSNYQAPVFICIDIEVWERDNRKLTEIGVCTLDTKDLDRIAPGDKGQGWMKQLRCRHFRILEHAHMNNVEFVSGCADRFEFGLSEWISIKDAPYVLASCFKAPFSEPGKYTPYSADLKQGLTQVSRPKQRGQDPLEIKRNLILVGHEIGSDIGYMRTAGYDVGNLPNLVEAIDTTVLFRAYKHEQNPRSLGAILLELEIKGWNLHNAGNDAAYTLQALLAISIASLSPANAPPSEPGAEELETAEASARERIREDYEEWNLAEADGGDGGDPVAVLPWSEAQQIATWNKGMRTAEKAEKKRDGRFARDMGRPRDRPRGVRTYQARNDKGPDSGAKPAGKKLAVTRTLDVDAMDEAMMGSTEPIPAAPDGHSSELNTGPDAQVVVKDGKDKTSLTHTNDSRETAEAYLRTSGYLPPHLRHLKVAVTGNEKATEISDKMAARLKFLDTNGK